MEKRRTHTRLQLAAAIALALPTVVFAQQKPSYEELESKVSTLETRLQQVETQIQARPSAVDVDQTVREVLKDSERRSQLLSTTSPATAGYDNGFFVKSEDGSFSLRPSVFFQFRNSTAYREGAKNSGDDDIQNGFEIRRLRPVLAGNVISPDLTYYFQWESATGTVTLLDAYATYRLNPDWFVKVGQFTDPVNRETLDGPARQLAAELSLVDQYLSVSQIDRVQGASLIYGNYGASPLNAELVFHDGANTKNTNFTDIDASTPPRPTNFGVTGRAEYKVLGDWKNYRDFTAKGTKQDLFVVGAGGDFTQGDNRNQYIGNVDAQYELPNGLGFYAAYLADLFDYRNVTGEDNRLDHGFVAQVGYLLSPTYEIFGRYNVLFLDEDFVAAGSSDQYQEITVGLNWFLGKDGSAGHRAKFTFDVGYLPDGAPAGLTGLDILASEEPEFVARAQFQLQI